MKKQTFLFAVILIFRLVQAQNESFVYEWPIKGGTAEWKALQTHAEMLAVLQIPDDILNKMSTHDLVETCLNYPLFPDVWAFNSYQQGIDNAIANFNGFQELLERAEAGIELMNKYLRLDLSDLSNKKSNYERGEYKIQLCKYEALLSQSSILQNISIIERKQLLFNVLEKNKTMFSSGNFSFYSYESNSFLAVRILEMENFEPLSKRLEEDKILQQFINHGTGITLEVIEDIIEITNLYLSNNN